VDFTEDPDHRLIRAAIREICTRFPDEYWAELDQGHTFPWEFYDAMAKGGWIGIAIPAEYGGGGCGITEASIVLEEVAASGACMNGASSIHLSIFGMHPVVKHGSAELKQRHLPASPPATCTWRSALPSRTRAWTPPPSRPVRSM
jgi:acyl-CoA dehydrogenase